jgi:hypothetical protein
MKYSTYVSASEKVSAFGQNDLAKRLIEHANLIEQKKIEDLKFDILVGKVKAFDNAIFHSVRVLREKEAITVMFIFTSGQNTHRINCTLKQNGEIVWCDGNLFKNRSSVKNFTKLFYHLTNYNKDIRNVLKESEISVNSLNVVNRTFYI